MIRKMVGPLPSLYPATQASNFKRLASNLSFSTIRRYKYKGRGEEHGIDKERAPTTAEEFKRVAEEKSRQSTAEKASDAAEEATVAGASQAQPVKQAYKEATNDED